MKIKKKANYTYKYLEPQVILFFFLKLSGTSKYTDDGLFQKRKYYLHRLPFSYQNS